MQVGITSMQNLNTKKPAALTAGFLLNE